jgi:hypothetical protein
MKFPTWQTGKLTRYSAVVRTGQIQEAWSSGGLNSWTLALKRSLIWRGYFSESYRRQFLH